MFHKHVHNVKMEKQVLIVINLVIQFVKHVIRQT